MPWKPDVQERSINVFIAVVIVNVTGQPQHTKMSVVFVVVVVVV